MEAIGAVRNAYARTFMVGPSDTAVSFYLADAGHDVAAIDKAQRTFDGIGEGAWAGYNLGTEGGRFARLIEAGYALRLNTGSQAAAVLTAASDMVSAAKTRRSAEQQADIDSRMSIIRRAEEMRNR
jgi:hypothetical protein